MTAPSTVDVADLASRLRLGVTRLARKLRQEGDPGLTLTLLSALATIYRNGAITPGDLAAHEQIRRPTATRLVASLVERGLVERAPDPLDGRVSWLTLSPEGKKLVHRYRRRTTEYLAAQIRDLPREDIEALDRASSILERLTGGAQ